MSEDGDDGATVLSRLYSGAIDCARPSMLFVPSEYTGTVAFIEMLLSVDDLVDL